MKMIGSFCFLFYVNKQLRKKIMEISFMFFLSFYAISIMSQQNQKCNCSQQRVTNRTCGRMPVAGLITCNGKRFNPQWTAIDVKSVSNCTQWTAELVNKLSSSEAARGFTAQCLSQFNVVGIEKKFLEKIPLSEVKAMEIKTLNELITGPVEIIPREEEWFKTIIDRVDWEKAGGDFALKMTSNRKVLELLFETYSEQPEKLKIFFTKRTFKKIPNAVCSLLTKEFIETCSEKAFKGLKGDCLSFIPGEAFRGFTLNKFKQINSKALESLKREQADELNDEIIANITVDMARHWGRVGDIPKIESGDKEEVKAQTELVTSYLQTHPCMALKGVKKEKIKILQAKKTINLRCSLIWKNKLSKSNFTKSSLTISFSLLLATFLFYYE